MYVYSFKRRSKPLPPAIRLSDNELLGRDREWLYLGTVPTPFDTPPSYRPPRGRFSLFGQLTMEGFSNG